MAPTSKKFSYFFSSSASKQNYEYENSSKKQTCRIACRRECSTVSDVAAFCIHRVHIGDTGAVSNALYTLATVRHNWLTASPSRRKSNAALVSRRPWSKHTKRILKIVVRTKDQHIANLWLGRNLRPRNSASEGGNQGQGTVTYRHAPMSPFARTPPIPCLDQQTTQ